MTKVIFLLLISIHNNINNKNNNINTNEEINITLDHKSNLEK